MITVLHWGEGSLGTPKSDNVICARPLIHNDFHFLFSSGHLYAATVADFSGTDSLIIKDSLRTEQYDYKHLNGKYPVIITKDRFRLEVIIITKIINES